MCATSASSTLGREWGRILKFKKAPNHRPCSVGCLRPTLQEELVFRFSVAQLASPTGHRLSWLVRQTIDPVTNNDTGFALHRPVRGSVTEKRVPSSQLGESGHWQPHNHTDGHGMRAKSRPAQRHGEQARHRDGGQADTPACGPGAFLNFKT